MKVVHESMKESAWTPQTNTQLSERHNEQQQLCNRGSVGTGQGQGSAETTMAESSEDKLTDKGQVVQGCSSLIRLGSLLPVVPEWRMKS